MIGFTKGTLVALNQDGVAGLVQLPPEQCNSFVRAVALDKNGDILLAARSALRVKLGRASPGVAGSGASIH